MAHEHIMALRAGYDGEIWAECVDLDCNFRIEEVEIIAVIHTQHKWILSEDVYGIREKQLKNKRAAQQSVQPTAAGGSDSGENSESGGG